MGQGVAHQPANNRNQQQPPRQQGTVKSPAKLSLRAANIARIFHRLRMTGTAPKKLTQTRLFHQKFALLWVSFTKQKNSGVLLLQFRHV